MGNGEVAMSGNNGNDYTGVTTVAEGRLTAGDDAALGAIGLGNGTTVSEGATLNIDNAAIGSEAVNIAGAGVGGNGALTGIQRHSPVRSRSTVTQR